MSRVRLGAVEYLNARPLVYDLERDPSFRIRFDVPARCAALLHEGDVDVGLIPSIEYLRGDRGDAYRIVPDLAIASRGAVASVALFTKRPLGAIRSIAVDTSSRTSAALVRVLCARVFDIDPVFVPHGPDLVSMLASADAALLIGDKALLETGPGEKIDLGQAWAEATGLPFVYAFWAGRPGALGTDQILALHRARDAGVTHVDAVARAYFSAPAEQALGARYLRDNIWYTLGADERKGLELFYQYARDLDLAPAGEVQFY
jgi:chorismate dehydratase